MIPITTPTKNNLDEDQLQHEIRKCYPEISMNLCKMARKYAKLWKYKYWTIRTGGWHRRLEYLDHMVYLEHTDAGTAQQSRSFRLREHVSAHVFMCTTRIQLVSCVFFSRFFSRSLLESAPRRGAPHSSLRSQLRTSLCSQLRSSHCRAPWCGGFVVLKKRKKCRKTSRKSGQKYGWILL